jgi:hypothetical protein
MSAPAARAVSRNKAGGRAFMRSHHYVEKGRTLLVVVFLAPGRAGGMR